MNMQFGFAWAVSQALVDALWQLAALGALAAMVLGAMREHAAAARHAVGMVFLLAMLALPLATMVRHWPQAAEAADVAASLVSADTGFTGPFALAATAAADRVARVLGESWFVWLAQAWLVGVVAIVALQLGGGWQLLRGLDRGSRMPLPPAWAAEVERLRSMMGIARRVTVQLAARVGTPFTARILRPVIWLPLALLDRLPAAQVTALLAHELAHVRRLDWLWNGVQCLIEALLFFHPAMWWLSRRIRQDRELACDELAVAVSGDRLALADALHALARQGWHTPTLLLSAQGGSLMTRITHLLQSRRTRTVWRAPVALVLLAAASALLAMQAEAPLQVLSNVQIQASSTGALGPGQSRELSATTAEGRQLRYRLAVDAQGRISESYTEDGQPRPIDDAVRQTLRLVQQGAWLPVPPIPPTLPTPTPPAPQVPAPPTPPVPPAVDDSAELRSIAAVLRADLRVANAVGANARVERGSFDGRIQLWDGRELGLGSARQRAGGSADFSLTMSGDKGRIRVAAAGTLRDSSWTLSRIALSPLSDAPAARSP